jgi:hypothetical protein
MPCDCLEREIYLVAKRTDLLAMDGAARLMLATQLSNPKVIFFFAAIFEALCRQLRRAGCGNCRARSASSSFSTLAHKGVVAGFGQWQSR